MTAPAKVQTNEYVSLFDLFKIGIGPSSSHVVGPMRAARHFTLSIGDQGLFPLAANRRIRVTLFGSLAWTGKGHGTDGAILLGLMGHTPDGVDPAAVEQLVVQVRAERCITRVDGSSFLFDAASDLVFDFVRTKPYHSNAMQFCVMEGEQALVTEHYYSVGGGFIVKQVSDDVNNNAQVGSRKQPQQSDVPLPFRSMAELIGRAAMQHMTVAQLMMRNEIALLAEAEVNAQIDLIALTMHECIDRGLVNQGVLPGHLKVRRRAAELYIKLKQAKDKGITTPTDAIDWVSVWAIAVNEENAAGGRVVTAPTNGAAGVVPAVLRYYRDICNGTLEGARTFMLAATAVGALCKMNASISGAEAGCQGEVGSAAAMAAAGLAAALGADNLQVENAAEIALEHHLGMTCDPVGGLVQVPCIERNAMGAIKAIAAASLAMKGDGKHMVTLDQAIETMRQTGHDMQSKYKETAQGGLAVNVVAC
jgi:L-serine dehydratase